MRVVDAAGTIQTGGFDWGCSHSYYERVVYDSTAKKFVNAAGMADVHLLHFATGAVDKDLIISNDPMLNARSNHLAKYGTSRLLAAWETAEITPTAAWPIRPQVRRIRRSRSCASCLVNDETRVRARGIARPVFSRGRCGAIDRTGTVSTLMICQFQPKRMWRGSSRLTSSSSNVWRARTSDTAPAGQRYRRDFAAERGGLLAARGLMTSADNELSAWTSVRCTDCSSGAWHTHDSKICCGPYRWSTPVRAPGKLEASDCCGDAVPAHRDAGAP
jgi:hypothetical protein